MTSPSVPTLPVGNDTAAPQARSAAPDAGAVERDGQASAPFSAMFLRLATGTHASQEGTAPAGEGDRTAPQDTAERDESLPQSGNPLPLLLALALPPPAGESPSTARALGTVSDGAGAREPPTVALLSGTALSSSTPKPALTEALGGDASSGPVRSDDRAAALPLAALIRSASAPVDVEVGRDAAAATGHTVASLKTSADAVSQANGLLAPLELADASSAPARKLDVQPALGSPRWGDAVGQHITWMANNNVQGAKLQLHPPHLGALDVRISMDGEQASIHFATPHAPVREALDAALPRLREMLGAQGLNLVDVNVSQHGQAEHREQGGSHSQTQAPQSFGAFEPQVDTTQLQPRLHRAGAALSLVDYYA